MLGFLLLSAESQAQKEANIWIFGNKAGLDFNHSPPKGINTSSMNTLEGCASIADDKGALLFYTDGISVWSKNHNLMSQGTGLNGNGSSTQSAVIVPKPGSSTNYYIFTVDGSTGRRKGGYYNEVDMSRNGGLGEVILKNQVLINSPTNTYPFESIGATSHANGTDFWVCYADMDSTLKSFRVTSSGVIVTPVISKPGNIHERNMMTFYMKFSSNNKLMAYSSAREGLKLLKFDDRRGTFTRPITVSSTGSYGVEFSPNSELLYTSTGDQYKVSVHDSTTIVNSKYSYLGSFNRRWCAVQLAPDQKIYLTLNATSRSKISVITNPDSAGSSCNFLQDTIDVGGLALIGLPTFLQSYLDPSFTVAGGCFGDTTWFRPSNPSDLDSMVWYTGDSTKPIVALKKDSFTYGHIYKYPGKYQTMSIAYLKNRSDTFRRTVTIRDFLNARDLIQDTIFKCQGETLNLQADDTAFSRFLWSTSDSTLIIKTDTPGRFWLRAYPKFKCFYTDTVIVRDYPNNIIPNELHLPKDIDKCPEDTVNLKADETFKRYVWNTGDSTPAITTAKPGTYILKGYNSKKCYSVDTVIVKNYQATQPDLGADSSFCNTGSSKVRVGDVNTSFWTYKWNTGSTDPFLFTDTSGQYSLEVTNAHGCIGRDTVEYSFYSSKPKIDIGIDQVFCDSFPPDSFVQIKNTGDDADYLWMDNTTDSFRVIDIAGLYKVTATNACGSHSDSLEIELRKSPRVGFSMAVQDHYCDSMNFVLQPVSTGYKPDYEWNTGDTTLSLRITKPGDYSLVASNQCGSDTLAFTMFLTHKPTAAKLNDTSFCIPLNHILRVPSLDSSNKYKWTIANQLVSEDDSVKITNDGTCILNIENQCGTHTDTFEINSLDVPQVDLGPDADRCDSLNLLLDVHTADNEEVYEWSTTETTPSIVAKQEGLYWVKASNRCGESIDSIEIHLHYTDRPNLPSDSVLCDLDSIVLNAEIPGTHNVYNWSTGETTPRITVKKGGLYKVDISNPCLSQEHTVDLTFLSVPRKTLQNEYVYCDQTELTRLEVGQNDNGETYLWSTGETAKFIEVNKADVYWVQLTNLCGQVQDSTKLRISHSPTIDLGPDTPMCGNIALVLNAGDPELDYVWSPDGQTSPGITATEQKTYSVVATNQDGCNSTDTITITDWCRSHFYLPNVFRPNGDQLNDVYRPEHVVNADKYQMEIYNRWGELLFTSQEVNQGWDGTYKGQPCQEGVYMVIIRYFNHELGKYERVTMPFHLLR